MKRRDFLQYSGLGLGAMMVPSLVAFSKPVAAEHLIATGMDAAAKKLLADVALNTTKSLGATYTDVRIGRYLQQFLLTREKNVQGITNAESFGVGIRVIANGTWGFFYSVTLWVRLSALSLRYTARISPQSLTQTRQLRHFRMLETLAKALVF